MKTTWPREKARRECLTAAVWYLWRKKFELRAIADALAITRERVRQIYFKERRRRFDADKLCTHSWKAKDINSDHPHLICTKCGRLIRREHFKWTVVKAGNLLDL